MNGPRRSLLILVFIALAIGLAEPPLEIAWKCRTGLEASEACVWGKSYLPLGRVVGLVIISPVSLGILLLGRWGWQSRSGRTRPPV
jgi:hypothetical protein